MIELRGLRKAFGDHVAVDGLDLTVSPGEVFGCLGPNGAGKTTTIRLLMGLLLPDAGEVRLGGHDLHAEPEAAKRLCGFVPDRPYLYDKLTGREFLSFAAGLHGIPRTASAGLAQRLLTQFQLEDRGDELIETYSHGMKQRTVMAAALIHSPRVLVLDEPMVGLDPRGARHLREMLRQLAREGVAVFLSTHSLDVATASCDRIGILDRGRWVGLGTLAELRAVARERADADLESIFLQLTESGSDGASGLGS